MLRATIHLNGAAYQGVDPDGSEEARPALPTNSFHSANNGRDVLRWGNGAAHICVGPRNIQSHLARIMERISDGTLPPGQLVIDFND